MLHLDTPATTGQLEYPVLESVQTLLGPANFLPCEGETQEFAFCCFHNFNFPGVNLQFQFAFNELGNVVHHPIPCTLTFDENNEIITEFCKAMTTLFKLLVELVEDHIRQQG